MSNELKVLCESIWNKPEYKSALEVLYANKPNKLDVFRDVLKACKYETKTNSGVYNFFISFNERSPLYYRLIYSTKGNGLDFVIATKEEQFNTEDLEKFDCKIERKYTL